MAGITATGFERKRLADIKQELEQTFRATFGQGINVTPQSAFGQLIGIFSEREDLVWQAMEDVYFSQYPDTAFGVSLENVAAISGIVKLPARPALVDLTITGTPGTVIPVNSLCAIPSGGPQFKTLTAVTIPVGGTVVVGASSVNTGNITALAGTITAIVNPISGWTSVTNALDATPGREVETDAALRARRNELLQKAGAGTVEAIRARVLSVDNVTKCVVFENDTFVTDSNGLPGKSFAVYVQNGAAQDIANAIWQSKPAGMLSYGSQSNTVIDSQGLSHIINWNRPVEKNIYVRVDVVRDPITFPVNGTTLVMNAILGYGNGLDVGDPVIVVPGMIAALASIPGILDIDIFVGLAASPTLSNNIIQQINEIAKFDSTRVTINVSP